MRAASEVPRSRDLAPFCGADERERQRARLEQACRYVLRPPVAFDRVAGAGDGQAPVRERVIGRRGPRSQVVDEKRAG